MLHNLIWHPNMSLEDAEKIVIISALKFFRGNKLATAQALKISPRGLDIKLDCINGKKPEDYGIEEKRQNRKLRKNDSKEIK